MTKVTVDDLGKMDWAGIPNEEYIDPKLLREAHAIDIMVNKVNGKVQDKTLRMLESYRDQLKRGKKLTIPQMAALRDIADRHIKR